jgi:tRNA 2-thiouridine synthesizing protein B
MDFAQLYTYNDQISIYLVGNGVYGARKNYQNPDLKRVFKNSKVYVYSDDMKARGIEYGELKEGLMVFHQYDDLVMEVMENFHQVVSF